MTDTTTDVAADLASPWPLALPHGTTKAAELTAAEHAVLHLLANGRSNAQIGQCLGRSEKAVRNQRPRIYAKLGVVNRTEAVAVHMRVEFWRGK
jgi:DNA-binding CsgD family transcriptional regulator